VDLNDLVGFFWLRRCGSQEASKVIYMNHVKLHFAFNCSWKR